MAPARSGDGREQRLQAIEAMVVSELPGELPGAIGPYQLDGWERFGEGAVEPEREAEVLAIDLQGYLGKADVEPLEELIRPVAGDEPFTARGVIADIVEDDMGVLSGYPEDDHLGLPVVEVHADRIGESWP